MGSELIDASASVIFGRAPAKPASRLFWLQFDVEEIVVAMRKLLATTAG